MISYKPEYFDLVNQLTLFNDKIVIQTNNNNKTIIKCQDDDKTAAYILVVDNIFFNIPINIGFYKYSEFYRFFKTLNNPIIDIDGRQIILSKNESKFRYTLNDTSKMKTGPNDFIIDNPDAKFLLDSDSLLEIIKMNSLLKNSKYSEFICSNETICVKLFSDEGDNLFEKNFKNLIISKNDIIFKIFSDFFTKLPNKFNYNVLIKEPGHLIFDVISDTIKLKLYTALIKPRKG